MRQALFDTPGGTAAEWPGNPLRKWPMPGIRRTR